MRDHRVLVHVRLKHLGRILAHELWRRNQYPVATAGDVDLVIAGVVALDQATDERENSRREPLDHTQRVELRQRG